MNHTELKDAIACAIHNNVIHEDYSQVMEATKEIMELIPHWIPIEGAELKDGEKYDVFTKEENRYSNMTFAVSSVESYFFWPGFAIMQSEVTHVMKPIPNPS